MEVVVMSNFKATYCGAEYHNIDGTGWPYAVVMENQGSVFDGTYESIRYYPERTTKLVWDKYDECWKCKACGEDWGEIYFIQDCIPYRMHYCSNCGTKITGAISDAD